MSDADRSTYHAIIGRMITDPECRADLASGDEAKLKQRLQEAGIAAPTPAMLAAWRGISSANLQSLANAFDVVGAKPAN